MKALIHKGRVCDVCSEEFPVADGFAWIDCDDTVEIDDKHIDGQFIKKQKEQVKPDEIVRNKMPEPLDQLEIICHALADLDAAGVVLKQDAKDLIKMHQDAKAARV